MNITMIHDFDVGFLANTLKPAFQALGHTCTVLQTKTTYLESDTSHIDVLLEDFNSDAQEATTPIIEDTDLFFLRAMSDVLPRALDLPKYVNKNNTIYRVHGGEMRENQFPYSSRLWRTHFSGREPYLIGSRDSTLHPFYRHDTITHIERPIRFDIIPKKRIREEYILHTSTHLEKKGTRLLLALAEKKKGIPLHIIAGVPREECLRWKAGASYLIDNIGEYLYSPYHMSAVEGWLLKIPVFASYGPMGTVFCPELPDLIHNTSIYTLVDDIRSYEPDRKQLNNAYHYARNTHNPITIAKQYLALAEHIMEVK